ncbi:TniQ family protein [Mesorhizobium sp. Cs1299R1N1]|uniref:TniQ family protein n=1 Tax=Mesorhizobium sp. Cs1299R1N1 TaxID=3015172 RepID=UPI003FA598F4
MIGELGGTKPLPVILEPVPDELLSSWIARHVGFYGVSPLTMLRHAIPEAKSLRLTDTKLGATDAGHVARLFRTQSSAILAMTTSGFPSSAARLVTRYSMLLRLCRAKQRAGRNNCGAAKLDAGLADNLSRLRTTATRHKRRSICAYKPAIAVRGSLERCPPR